jgi:hypothetical protein
MTFDEWPDKDQLDLAQRAVYIEIMANSTGRSPVSDEALRGLAAGLGYRSTDESYDHNELFRPIRTSRP